MTGYEITASVIGVAFAAIAVWPSIRPRTTPTTHPAEGDDQR